MAEKSAGNSVNGRPFTGKDDPRNGRGPEPGAPNAGRTPSIVAAACRLAFDERVQLLCDIADGKPVDTARAGGKAVKLPAQVHERLKAIELLARYGGMASVRVTDAEGEDLKPRSVGVIVFGNREIPL